MAKKLFKRYLPSGRTVTGHRAIRALGPWLTHPNLWHLNRRSAAGGVAVGLASGLIPGPFQVLAAALLAMAFKVNLPTAVVTTFYTNPLTIVPLYLLAYALGGLVSGESVHEVVVPDFDWSLNRLGETVSQFCAWLLSLGHTLAIGLVIECVLFSVLGYFSVRALWRWHAIREWRRRAARPRPR